MIIKEYGRSKYFWILDAGHGKGTPGKRSPDGSFFEWEFNRAVVNEICEMLSDVSIDHCILVPDDGDISLPDRCLKANLLETDLPKRFISIHSNAQAGGWGTANGYENFVCKPEYRSNDDEDLGRALFKRMEERKLFKMREGPYGNFKVANFYVIRNVQMPACLTENGFFTNKEEVEKLKDPHFRKEVAAATILGIMDLENVNVAVKSV